LCIATIFTDRLPVILRDASIDDIINLFHTRLHLFNNVVFWLSLHNGGCVILRYPTVPRHFITFVDIPAVMFLTRGVVLLPIGNGIATRFIMDIQLVTPSAACLIVVGMVSRDFFNRLGILYLRKSIGIASSFVPHCLEGIDSHKSNDH
jgi:hypothetical protein